MEKVKVKLDPGAVMPTKANDTDAGFDLYSRTDMYLRPNDSYTFDTGAHIQIPKGYAGLIKSRSGMNIKHSITCEGVIDAGYTGSIRVKLRNESGSFYDVEAGDRIAQLVIVPIPELELVEVDELDGSDRGDNGFGSSGK